MTKHTLCQSVVALIALFLLPIPTNGQETIRIATYNIKFLDAAKLPSEGDRQEKLQEVIERLNANVIALEEIDDRAALEAIFDPHDWQLIIDDDSGNNQDVALAIRHPLRAKGIAADLDADDEQFLFPDSADNSAFPRRRDVLSIEVEVPGTGQSFFVLVVHAKSRFGGRATTEPRRIAAARELLQVIDQRFQETNFVLLGDWNDNYDDASLNILESGDPDAPGGPEDERGPFLINLTESLGIAGHVSHGRSSSDIVGDRINTLDLGSRQRNNDGRGTNANTGDILFDQILVPAQMEPMYLIGSVKVFDDAVAIRGNSRTRASDHLPVYADFIFSAADDGDAEPPEPTPADGIRIASLLPDPAGVDRGNEEVTLRNGTTSPQSLDGWFLIDKANHRYDLAPHGSIPAGESLKIKMEDASMPLTNTGDVIELRDSENRVRDTATYTKAQVRRGVPIDFP